MLAKFSSSALLWLPATLAVYYLTSEMQRRAGNSPLLNPTLLTIIALSAALVGTGVPYADYFASIDILHHLLGTAIVALAIPLYENMRRMDGNLRAIAAALLCGSMISMMVGLVLAQALGASLSTLLSIAPKSATAAVSMEISRVIGGVPAVTVCLTIFTGITGAVLGPYLLTASGVHSPFARGVALGTASHGIATARAFSEDEVTGCWATLAMGLNAVVTAAFAPHLLSALLGGR